MGNNDNKKKKKFSLGMLEDSLDKLIKKVEKKVDYKKLKEDEDNFHFTKVSVSHGIDTVKQNVSTYSILIVMIAITLAVIIGSFMIFGNKNEGTEISSLNKGEYSIKMHINFVGNFIFSKYDVKLSLGDKTTTLSHGEDEDIEFYLDKGDYTLSFVNADDSSIRSEEKIEINSDTEIGYKIECYFDEIVIDRLYFDKKRPLTSDEIKINFDKSEFDFKDYKDVINTLKEMGFTNIVEKPLYDIVYGFTSEGTIENVIINDTSDYIKGNIFKKDVQIIISYHLKQIEQEEPVEEQPVKESVYYSTNDKDSVKNGNTGVYAYKSYDSQYDTYWIIDFDSGYVYNYFEGNGDNICSRLKIDSGNLNDYVKITWHNGNDVWSYGLHFKWKNQPDTLIVQDNDGYEDEYSTTSLTQALNLRDKKTIKEY